MGARIQVVLYFKWFSEKEMEFLLICHDELKISCLLIVLIYQFSFIIILQNNICFIFVTLFFVYDLSRSKRGNTDKYGGPQLSRQNKMLTSNSNHSQQTSNPPQQITDRSHQIQIAHSSSHQVLIPNSK